MTTIFVLCAGSGDRWNDHLGVPKQLVTFGGVSLLERTARQIQTITNASAFCVTRDVRICHPSYTTLLLPPNQALAETICATAPYWSRRNIFLLGDVFYSDRALHVILNAPDDLQFFGRPWPSAYVACGHGEMFGAAFTVDGAKRMFRAAAEAIAARRGGAPGNLWNIYQLVAGLSLGSSKRVSTLLQAIDDYTNDIDSPADYERRRLLYEQIASGRLSRSSRVARHIANWPRHSIGRLRWWLS